MAKIVHPRGNPQAPVWVLVHSPYKKDADKHFVFSSGLGYHFDKMMKEAGFKDYYVFNQIQDFDDLNSFNTFETEVRHYKPPILIPLGKAAAHACGELNEFVLKYKAKGDPYNAALEKYSGSILTTKIANYPHYAIPSYMPDYSMINWDQRDVIVNLDLGKAKSELEFFQKNSYLQPLPNPTLIYDATDEEIEAYLIDFDKHADYLSTDIESLYFNKNSPFAEHPGHMVTLGLAPSKDLGISFNIFRDDLESTARLWKLVYKLLSTKKIIGQNFFNFDWYRLQMYGFELPLMNIRDTLINHHILWPELPHKLQFLTKQYTRHPYYKDEGQGWSVKNMSGYRKYNCKDVCITFEVWEEQQKELIARDLL